MFGCLTSSALTTHAKDKAISIAFNNSFIFSPLLVVCVLVGLVDSW